MFDRPVEILWECCFGAVLPFRSLDAQGVGNLSPEPVKHLLYPHGRFALQVKVHAGKVRGQMPRQLLEDRRLANPPLAMKQNRNAPLNHEGREHRSEEHTSELQS